MTRRHLTHRQSWRTEKTQEEHTAQAARRESRTVEKLEGGDLGPEQTGQVTAHFGVQVEVESADDQTFRCHLRANLPALVIGDQVVQCTDSQGIGVVVMQLPRRSEPCHPDMRGLLKPVAANIDRIVIVFAPYSEPHANLIDRYLIAAEHAGTQSLLLLNKAGLVDESNVEDIGALLNVYCTLGHPLIEVPTLNDLAMDGLRGALDAHMSVFVGQSGVGRSSLVNALLPDVDIRVSDLSTVIGKGTCITTTTRLSHFPGGGDLIGSPSIREFNLGHVSRDDAKAGFIKSRDLLGHCHSRDCKYDHEPGYALLQVLEDGCTMSQHMVSYRHTLTSMPETDY